jgi:hypothetical protein
MTTPGTKVVWAEGGRGSILLYADNSTWVAIRDFDWLEGFYIAFGTVYPVNAIVFLHSGSSGETWRIEGNEESVTPVYSTSDLPPRGVRCLVRTDGLRDTVDWPAGSATRYWKLSCEYYDHTVIPSIIKPVGTPVDLYFTFKYGTAYVDVYANGKYVQRVTLSTSGYIGVKFPDKVPIIVSWDGISVRMWGLPKGFSTLLGYTPSGNVPTVGGWVYNAVAYGVETDYRPAYRYTLEVVMDYGRRLKDRYTDGTTVYYLYEVDAAGSLTLYLWDREAAYDAYRGTGYVVETKQLPEPGRSYSPRENVCIPQIIATEEDLYLTEFKPGTNSYDISVTKEYKVREVGCGVDRTYTEKRRVDATTVDGTTLLVSGSCNPRDPPKVCNYHSARQEGDRVCCP